VNPFFDISFLDEVRTDYLDAMTNEWYIYGSSGHGRFARAFPVEGGRGGYKNEPLLSPLYKQSRYLKHKQYELKDHLGNVRVVVSDLKNSKTIGSSNPPYRAEVLAAYNYYPFGMLQPGMYKENNDKRYRFGFNGMLRDDDVTDKLSTGPDEGRGNSYSTQFRQYDPRVTRWFSNDPLKMKFPWTSPYTGMGNNPVMLVDPLGSETTPKLEKNVIAPLANEYNRNIESINDKINNSSDQKEISLLQNDKQNWLAEQSKFNEGVQELRDSKVLYDWGEYKLDKIDRVGGFTFYNKKNNSVSMNLMRLGDRGTIGSFRHELQHFFQFERGQISFSSNGRFGGLLYDAMDEVDAFQSMHIFGEGKDYGIFNNVIVLPSKYYKLIESEKHINNGINSNRSLLHLNEGEVEYYKNKGEIFNENAR
jgi:RHS repeat-associated protein